MRTAYCPYCGDVITLREIEYQTGNLVWETCARDKCPGKKHIIKTDSSGFVMYPGDLVGRYLYSIRHSPLRA